MRPQVPENVLTVAGALRELGLGDVTYVGGAVVPLLLTYPAAPRPRVTLDVDAVVDAATRLRFNAIEERLRAAGYAQPPGGPICRWLIEGVLVDLMPVEADVLGFSNPWYRYLSRSYAEIEIAPGNSLRIASPATWLARKLQAYPTRGAGDLFASQDIEGIRTIAALP